MSYRKGASRPVDGFGAEAVYRQVVVSAVNGGVGEFIAFGGRVEVEMGWCGSALAAWKSPVAEWLWLWCHGWNYFLLHLKSTCD